LAALRKLVKPGGHVIVSTLNRNLKAFAVAIIGAEYIARVLPRGTHDYLKFIRPSELARWGRDAGLDLTDLTGIAYNPLTRAFRLSPDTSVNYLAHFRGAGVGGAAIRAAGVGGAAEHSGRQ
jgi:2-polyprenyl-6-hydroxyphenyl methylase/3-demethylubiquinone-9 3-methyltransferase